ncbi:MAG TPA: ArsR family transcriptional regulator [Firmicutes bacterium]|nr:ArsR family transcriptional regulator [Bacillota bacterium]
MEKELRMFKALSQETRFRIIHILVKSRKALCICEIMDALNKLEYDISRSLNILKNAGLVKTGRCGKVKLFEMKDDTEFDKCVKTFFMTMKPEKNSILEKDLKLLKKRLSLRVNNRCVITYK